MGNPVRIPVPISERWATIVTSPVSFMASVVFLT
jgi:hypothetical protein